MILSHATGLATVVAIALAPTSAQAPQLVKNINSQRVSSPSIPTQFVLAGNFTYFVAQGASGRELYRTLGYYSTTTLVAEIRPGPASSGISGMVALGNDVYFIANDGTHGNELWRLDGFAGTAAMVVDYNPSQRETGLSSPVVMGGDVYFIALDHRYRRVLVKTDGSAAGTRTLATISSLSNPSGSWQLGVFKNRVYFIGGNPQQGRELWRSDGTTAGTGLFVDLDPGAGNSLPQSFVATDTHLYFRAISGGVSRLYASDGTVGNTVPVTSGAQVTLINLRELTPIGDTLYFSRDDGVNGFEPWQSKGTSTSTAMILDINSGAPSSNPGDFCELNSIVYFRAGDQPAPRDNAELWRTDGTAAGTYQAVDIFPGDIAAKPAGMTVLGNEILMSARRDYEGTELFATDGTPQGTRLVRSICLRPNRGSSPIEFTLSGPLKDRVVFRADDGNLGSEPWVTDGKTSGTYLLRDIAGPIGFATQGSAPTALIDLFGTLLFVADDGVHGEELWRSDGTAAGTAMLRDIHLAGSSSPRSLRICGAHAYFSARDSIRGSELWRTDGTTAGTVLVKDIEPSTSGSGPSHFVSLHGRVIFRAYTTATGHEIFVTDGTANGTRLVKDINLGAQSSYPYELVKMGSYVYFRASAFGAMASDFELWRTDGTANGTVLVKDIRPGPGVGSLPHDLTATDSRLFFSADDGTNGRELWVSDGTTVGTVLLRDLQLGSLGSEPTWLTAVNGTVFFAATTAVTGNELFSSDGTPAGTKIVVDLNPSPIGARPVYLTAVGDQLFFQANTPNVGSQLWQTDGTPRGTVQLAGPTPTGNSFIFTPAGIGQRHLYFNALHPSMGFEPTRTDGVGTRLVSDINPGISSSLTKHYTLANSRVFFTAQHDVYGNELWSAPIQAHVQPIGEGHRFGAPPPQLDVSIPILGSSMSIRVSRGDANGAGVLILGAPASRPSVVGNGLVLYVDQVLPPALVWFGLDGRGVWQTSTAIPNSPVVIGITLTMQAGIDHPRTPPWGVATTRGVRVTVGL